MKLPPSLEKRIPPYSRRPLAAALALQLAVYWGTKLIAGSWRHYDLTTALDRAVPLLPWTTLIYFGAYLFWVAGYILATRQSRENAWRFLAADGLGKLLCAAIFLLLPTFNVRPSVPEAPFGWLLALLYRLDTPEDLFPSLHCFNSWLCWAGIRGKRTVPAGYRVFSALFALAVALSTLTTRQHVIADVAAGFALAELCWQLAGRTGLARTYGRIWERRTVKTGGSFPV